jgi:hypothetical protein
MTTCGRHPSQALQIVRIYIVCINLLCSPSGQSPQHFFNTLIALIITFGPTSNGKMPLESRFQEARAFLVAVLIRTHDMPEHWYAPMLPADHPSSFCKLTGLTTEELN